VELAQAMASLDNLKLLSASNGGLFPSESLAAFKKSKVGSFRLNSAPVRNPGEWEAAIPKTLRKLEVMGSGLADANLPELDAFELTTLTAEGKDITDAGCAALARIKTLEDLDISSSQVTDAGLIELEKLKKLKELDLTDTKVTPEGISKLQKALPKCKIIH
jgi:Leucine-rich repeat (LRR) protein